MTTVDTTTATQDAARSPWRTEGGAIDPDFTDYVWCPRCLADRGDPECCTPQRLARIRTVRWSG